MSVDQGGWRDHSAERSGHPPLSADRTSNRPLRVEFLADTLGVGGAERVVESLCLRLPDHGFEPSVSCLRNAGVIGYTLQDRGVPLFERLALSRVDPWQLVTVRRHLRRRAPDVVYALDHSNVLVYGRVAARWAGVPRQVCAVHRTRRADGTPSLSRIDRLLMPLSDAVIAVSEGQAAYLGHEGGVPPHLLRAIHNGVDPSRFLPPLRGNERRDRRRAEGLPPDAPLLIQVAQFRPEKNHRLMFEALAALTGEPAPQLVLVGGGPIEPELRGHARNLAIEDRVHWLGQRDDVPELLRVMDGLVLSSHPLVETFPISVLEAMAARLPVVSTDVGSLSEMVQPQQTGLLTPPGDARALAAAIASVFASPQRSAQWGEAGRARVESKFSEDLMVQRTADSLRELVGN